MFHNLLATEILAFKCKNAEHLTQGRWTTQGEAYVSLQYLLFKTFMSIYMAVTLAWSLIYRQLGPYVYGWKFFLYYTHWSYTILVVWSILDFGLVIYRHHLQSRRLSDTFWNQGDRFANRLLWLMTATAHAMAISVTITYYGFEYNPDSEAYKNVNPWLSLQEKFCTHNFHLIQTIWVVADTLSSSKPKRFLQFWPAIVVTMVYWVVHSAYILNGGTDPEGLPYLYNVFRWNVNPGQSTALAAAALVVTFGSHVLLWTIVIARDIAWRKLGFKTGLLSNQITVA